MEILNNIDLNALAQRVHKANEKWWQHPVTKERVERNKGELLMLVITELAEACEGERKGLMDDKLPHRKMAEVEMADAFIRLLDFAVGFDRDLYAIKELWAVPSNKGEALRDICVEVCRCDFSIPIAIWKIQSYCALHKYDLMGAFEEKMAYNATREDHKHEARLQAGGKQW